MSGEKAASPRRRRAILVGVVSGAVVLSGGGLLAASQVKSPAQIAANTAPPSPSLITAPVSVQTLAPSIVMRGIVYPANEYEVTPVAANPSVAALYVSKLSVATGAVVRDGELLGEVSGGPMFVLEGAVPAYRDLVPGDTGTDVAELQSALKKLGYSDGDTSGTYGSGTESAVTAFYRHLGYPAPTTTPTSGASGASGASATPVPYVPRGEAVFLPSFPATVLSVNASVGQEVSGAMLDLSTGRLSLTAELPTQESNQVKVGMKVQIFDETTNTSADGTVAAIGSPTTATPAGSVIDIGGTDSASSGAGSGSSGAGSGDGGDGGGGGSGATQYTPVVVTPDQALPAALNGENVRVTIETGSSTGPVLTVPVASIFTTASGQTEVTVVSGSGADLKQTNVAVTTGVSADGYVQVTPVTPATPAVLAAGDNVAVGG